MPNKVENRIRFLLAWGFSGALCLGYFSIVGFTLKAVMASFFIIFLGSVHEVIFEDFEKNEAIKLSNSDEKTHG